MIWCLWNLYGINKEFFKNFVASAKFRSEIVKLLFLGYFNWKKGSLESFRPSAFRPWAKKNLGCPFFNRDTQEKNQITLGKIFHTFQKDHFGNLSWICIGQYNCFNFFLHTYIYHINLDSFSEELMIWVRWRNQNW